MIEALLQALINGVIAGTIGPALARATFDLVMPRPSARRPSLAA